MSRGDDFAARVLETGAAGIAGMTLGLLSERMPEALAAGSAAWKSQLERVVRDLAAAVGAGTPDLFVSHVQWLRQGFEARALSDAALRESLRCLVLGATLSVQLDAVREAVAAIRAEAQRRPAILVGGPAFTGTGDLWRELGADALAATLEEAVSRAEALVG